jgi:hypothetical protein
MQGSLTKKDYVSFMPLQWTRLVCHAFAACMFGSIILDCPMLLPKTVVRKDALQSKSCSICCHWYFFVVELNALLDLFVSAALIVSVAHYGTKFISSLRMFN